jgi:hypothetical protein
MEFWKIRGVYGRCIDFSYTAEWLTSGWKGFGKVKCQNADEDKSLHVVSKPQKDSTGGGMEGRDKMCSVWGIRICGSYFVWMSSSQDGLGWLERGVGVGLATREP